MKKTHILARAIALRSLCACVTKEGIVAGTHHFVDLWARDSLFATFGANTVGMTDISRRTIGTFLRYQRSDGLVPYLILRSRHTLGKYFGRHAYLSSPVAHFRSHMSFGIGPDGGLMTIIAAWEAIRDSKDDRFLKTHYRRFCAAYSWYRRTFGNRLISEWYQCEWADAILKSGSTLYTNVLYFRAAKCMEAMAERLGKTRETSAYARDGRDIRRMINTELWTGSYFADWKDRTRQDYFASHPNMLAIVFGVATRPQAESILTYAEKRTWNGWTLDNSFPKYPLWRVPPLHTIIGMGDYHNGLVWLQPGIMYAVALSTCGKVRQARSVFDSITDRIITSGTVQEVYERSGEPVQRFVYRSEHPFAWSAGLYLWAGGILK